MNRIVFIFVMAFVFGFFGLLAYTGFFAFYYLAHGSATSFFPWSWQYITKNSRDAESLVGFGLVVGLIGEYVSLRPIRKILGVDVNMKGEVDPGIPKEKPTEVIEAFRKQLEETTKGLGRKIDVSMSEFNGKISQMDKQILSISNLKFNPGRLVSGGQLMLPPGRDGDASKESALDYGSLVEQIQYLGGIVSDLVDKVKALEEQNLDARIQAIENEILIPARKYREAQREKKEGQAKANLIARPGTRPGAMGSKQQ